MSNAPQLSALVTGASGGIGRAIAHQLATRGVRVAVHYGREGAAAWETLESLPGSGHVVVGGDLSDPQEVRRVWDETLAAFSRVQIVVNNAGIYVRHEVLTTDFADWVGIWNRTLQTNLIGPANLSYLAATSMSRSDGGRIVNVSSRGAFRGEPNAPAYGASKAGLNAMSQSLAKAFAARGVQCFVIAPGWVPTRMATDHLDGPALAAVVSEHPLGRMTTPEEVAKAVAFCALDAPDAMTGAIIDVNGASYLRT